MVGKYKVITLCGSTKFKDAFITAQKNLTLQGNIVISVGLFGHSGDDEVWTEGTKAMLDVVWMKVKQNKKFRQLLMAVPGNAILIEDTTYQKGATSSFWGAKNSERKEFSKLVEQKLDYENLDVSLEDEEVMREALVNQVCNIGAYVGCNVMGKILTICRKCLAGGTEPLIDYELLKSKHIHLLGKELTF